MEWRFTSERRRFSGGVIATGVSLKHPEEKILLFSVALVGYFITRNSSYMFLESVPMVISVNEVPKEKDIFIILPDIPPSYSGINLSIVYMLKARVDTKNQRIKRGVPIRIYSNTEGIFDIHKKTIIDERHCEVRERDAVYAYTKIVDMTRAITQSAITQSITESTTEHATEHDATGSIMESVTEHDATESVTEWNARCDGECVSGALRGWLSDVKYCPTYLLAPKEKENSNILSSYSIKNEGKLIGSLFLQIRNIKNNSNILELKFTFHGNSENLKVLLFQRERDGEKEELLKFFQKETRIENCSYTSLNIPIDLSYNPIIYTSKFTTDILLLVEIDNVSIRVPLINEKGNPLCK
ncbi:hypothetical protein NEFER03_0886 [Nematocida sp. LUAm3]|nr:hypothetical protein NEFER03_0886 [Nematocida sp. LUAm3]KAI5174904.1 hypothetical protein NEFER02_1004 [Nematocida sp. LUAm2]KAI5177498.1 hypothetical protein NEFER01_0748 [Nematocida sp. LUAm1]